MARKSNLVPVSVKKFDPSKQLCRKNITVHRDYLVIKMLWSETIQFGDRKLEIPLVKIPNSPFCPYQSYTNMCKLFPADNNDPAFLICHEHVRKV